MANSGSWLSSAAPIIGAGIDAVSGLIGGFFNANQARINRNFQREMYEKQRDDSIKMWKMANEYDLPSAQMQRLKDAGLNPLLMYSNGASGVTAANTLGVPSQPSGAQASADMRTQFGQAAAQAALIRAQIANINADTENKQATAEQSRQAAANLEYDVMFKRLTKEMDVAIKRGNIDQLHWTCQNLASAVLNTNEMTFQNARSMAQAREYEIKRYNLDANTIATQLSQGWKSIANDTERVKQGWRGLSIQWLNLKNTIRWTDAQISQLQWNVLKDMSMFGEQFKGLQLDNQLKRWDIHLRNADFTQKQVQTFNTMLKNFYLFNTGQETIGTMDVPRMLWQSTKKPTLQDLLIIPNLKTK